MASLQLVDRNRSPLGTEYLADAAGSVSTDLGAVSIANDGASFQLELAAPITFGVLARDALMCSCGAVASSSDPSAGWACVHRPAADAGGQPGMLQVNGHTPDMRGIAG